MVEPLLVANDLQRNDDIFFVVYRLHDLAEGPSAQHGQDLVSVLHMVSHNEFVVSALVIVAWFGGSKRLAGVTMVVEFTTANLLLLLLLPLTVNHLLL